MSVPKYDYPNAAEGALMEILNAKSSLHMEPKPIEEPKGEYLSDTDQWAQHASQHLDAAAHLASQTLEYLHRLETLLIWREFQRALVEVVKAKTKPV